MKLKQVLASCPHLDTTATHVRGFAGMLTGRHGERLDAWMAQVKPTTYLTCIASCEASGATVQRSWWTHASA